MNTVTDPFSDDPSATTEVVDERPAVPADVATERQWDYLISLAVKVAERGQNENERNIAGTLLNMDRSEMSKMAASSMIDALKTYPLVTNTAAEAEVPEGIHFHADNVYKVQVAHHGSGKKYAKRLDVETGAWDYVGRAPLVYLSERTLMTLEQAKQFGHLYGMCAKCGATLTDETSIAAGIGPVCATRF